MKPIRFILLLLAFTLSRGSHVRARSVVILDSLFEHMSIDNQMLRSSTEKAISIDEILTESDSTFELIRQPLVHTPPEHQSIWIKTRLINNSQDSVFIYEVRQAHTDTLKLWIVQQGKILKSYPNKGLYFPETNADRLWSVKLAYTYSLSIPIGDTITLYTHALANKGSYRVTNDLWTIEAYEQRKLNLKLETTYLIFCAGFSFIVIIISILFYFFTKDKINILYAAFIFTNVLNIFFLKYFISPLIIEDLFPERIRFSEIMGLAQVFFGIGYSVLFLQIERYMPKVYLFLKLVSWSTLIMLLLIVFFQHVPLITSVTYFLIRLELTFITLFIVGVAVALIPKKKLMAVYFVLAYLPLIYFVIHYFLSALHLTNSYNTLSWEFVIFFEIFMLTIAMAHRYYFIVRNNILFQETINKQQKEQINYVIEAQEAERKRIAKELHDGSVQEISSVILGLKHLVQHNQTSNMKRYQELLDSLELSSKELRAISHQMMPRSLTELGIVAATQDMLDLSFRYTDIYYVFDAFNMDKRLSSSIELTLYRVLQELSNNIIKHSKATEASFQLYQIKGFVLLIVEDNGVGMDFSKNADGMGILNIKSRLSTVSGSINFEKGHERGVLITIKIPISTD